MFRLRIQLPILYRFAAWLALFAMLTPVATGLVHHPAAALKVMSDCGMNMDASGAGHDKPKDTPQKAPACPICQSLHILGGGFVPPEPPVALIRVMSPVALFVAVWVVFHAAFSGPPQARPRAPPRLI